MTIPPLALLFICAACSTVLAYFFPLISYNVPIWIVGFVLIIGVIFLFPAVLSFVKNKTTVSPTTPDKASILVTDGIYSITRNPMYVGMLFLLLSFNLWLGAASTVILILTFFVLIDRKQITAEEKSLINKFGEVYQDYIKLVPRWLFVR